MNWRKANPEYQMSASEGANNRKNLVIEKMISCNPLEIFENFLDESILNYIMTQTKIYAQQKNDHKFSLEIDELKMFLGILYLSGYHSLARERLYWSYDEDVTVDCVSQCIFI